MSASNSRPRVSVVTPFHNTARYLRQCIESVLAQTYGDFEYILQDNASTDGGAQIVLEYAARDPRIRFFRHETLLPQIPNYNLALTRISASADYCKVAQADDWLEPDCLRRMVELGDREPRVGLISAYRIDGDELSGAYLPRDVTVMRGREAARLHLMTTNFLFGSPTTVMYRAQAVRARQPDFFPVDALNEDTELCFELLKQWDFGFVHEVLSHSRVEADSVTGRLLSKDPYPLSRLLRFHRYAPAFLDDGELREGLALAEQRYYRSLARAVLTRRGREFWRFHREWLRRLGLRIERGKLLRAIGWQLGQVAGSPGKALEFAREWRH